jgi:hypothetical protein
VCSLITLRKAIKLGITDIKSARWLHVSNSRSYYWGHSESEMSCDDISILNGYWAADRKHRMTWHTQDTITVVLPAQWDTPTLQQTRDGTPEWAVPWPMDWPWWTAELTHMITGPHCARCKGLHKNMVYHCKTNIRDKPFNSRSWKTHAWPSSMVQIITNFKHQ